MSRWVYVLALRFAALTVFLLGGEVAGGPPNRNEPAPGPLRVVLEGENRLLAFSPDGKTLATVARVPTYRWTVRVRDLATGAVRGAADAGWEQPGFLAFSPDVQRLALLSLPDAFSEPPFLIRLWDVENGKLKSERVLQPDNSHWPRKVEHFAFSPDGKTLAVGTPQEIVYFWETATGKVRTRFQGGLAVSFAGDGQTLIAVTHDGLIRRFALPACQLIGPAEPVRTDYLYVARAVFAPSGRLVALCDEWTTLVKEVATGRIGTHFIDTATGRERAWLPGEDGLPEFVGDGRYLACQDDHSVTLREAAAVFVRSGRAPDPARTTPPGITLEAELLTNPNPATLDLEADTPTEVSNRLYFGNPDFVEYPDPPQVELGLKVRNTGKKPVTVSCEPGLRSKLFLIGPGALNLPWIPRRVSGMSLGNDHSGWQTLAPGQSCTLRIAKFEWDAQAFWLLPGEYTIAGYSVVMVTPPPKGTPKRRRFDYGYVTVRLTPTKVTVLPGNNRSSVLPAKASQRIPTPPPGTVILPEPDRGAEKRLREGLAGRPVSLDRAFKDGRLLKDALEFLSDRYDLQIRIDEAAFKKAGKERPGEAKIVMGRVIVVSLDTALHIILDQVDAGMEIRNGAVWVVPLAKPQSLAERLRPIHKRVRTKALNTSVELSKGLPADTPLSDALEYLEDRFDLTLYLDTKAFERAGIKSIGERPVKLAAHENVSLAAVLQELLDPADATFVQRETMVLIIPKPKK
jgi:hypothetical protein